MVSRVSLKQVRSRRHFAALVAALEPEIVLRADAGAISRLSREIRGAQAAASRAIAFLRGGLKMPPALVNCASGIVRIKNNNALSALVRNVRGSSIVEVGNLAGPTPSG